MSDSKLNDGYCVDCNLKKYYTVDVKQLQFKIYLMYTK